MRIYDITCLCKRFSSDFLGLMKKVSKSPMVMDVLNIQGVQRVLERLADLLGKIQKALGEYLERERTSFPRFYFVGDEVSLIYSFQTLALIFYFLYASGFIQLTPVLTTKNLTVFWAEELYFKC